MPWANRTKQNGTTCRILAEIRTTLNLISRGNVIDLLKDLQSDTKQIEIGHKTKLVNFFVSTESRLLTL